MHYGFIGVPPSFDSDETSFKNAKLLAKIPFGSKRFPCYFHSFGLAGKDTAIFIESPLRVNLLKLVASGIIQKSFAECMSWKASLKTRFYVVSLTTGELHPIVYEADPFFTFHHINAFQDKDGQLVVDVAAYPRGDMILAWDTKLKNKTETENNPVAKRFVLPLNVPANAKPGQNLVTLEQTTATAHVQNSGGGNDLTRVFLTGEQLVDDWMELPRINYKLNGQKHNFVYAVSGSTSITNNDIEPDAIIKIDVNKREVKRWSEKGMAPSEPIFVPNPNKSDDEDEGVILTALMHKNEGAVVTLLILNAKDLTEVARVEFKTAGTFTGTFHGQWAGNGSKLHFY